MSVPVIDRLDDLARADPTLAPLARLYMAALRAAVPAWDEGLPPLDPGCLAAGQPLLHEQELTVAVELVGRLLTELATLAAESGSPEAPDARRALRGSALDPLAVLQASLAADTAHLAALAAGSGLDAGVLATLGHLAALPLLQACGRVAAPLLAETRWAAGYCPVCAGWPALAELRGLEARRWLRCGRCGTGWSFAHGRCPFCRNDDHRTLGYLAATGERETRQAATCDQCRGYLKTLTTHLPIPPAEICQHDLGSIEFDVAALERGYTRPEELGFPLRVRLRAAPRRATWRGWR
jgi:FdhE protein